MKVKIECEVAQSCLTLSDPMDCSLLGSSVRGILQARVLAWVAIAFSRAEELSGSGVRPLKYKLCIPSERKIVLILLYGALKE